MITFETQAIELFQMLVQTCCRLQARVDSLDRLLVQKGTIEPAELRKVWDQINTEYASITPKTGPTVSELQAQIDPLLRAFPVPPSRPT